MQWQLSEWLLLTSLILSYSFLIIIFSIKIHKYIFNKRKFLLFTYKGYEWQMSLPDRKVPSYPNCPKHHVYLSVYIGTGDQHLQKCPFCDVSFPAEDNVSSSIEARSVGIAILEGRYKG
jgi:hypothetical protein